MIETIKFENYKAFRTGELPIKPITILLGPNSSGKSSLLNLLLLLHQSMESPAIGRAFKFNGNFASFGEALNVVRKRDATTPFELTFKISPVPAINYSWYRSIAQQILVAYSHNSPSHRQSDSFQFALGLFTKEIKTEQPLNDNRSLVEALAKIVDEMSRDKKNERRRRATSDKQRNIEENLSQIAKTVDETFSVNQVLDHLKDLFKILLALPESASIDTLQYRFFYNKSSKNFEVSAVKLISENRTLLAYSCRRENGRRGYDLSSELIDSQMLSTHRTATGKMLNFAGMSPLPNRELFFGLTLPKNAVASLFCNMISLGCNAVTKDFGDEKINHVSPLRAFPQRYYLIDQSHNRNSLNTRDGDSLADILKRKSDVRDQVNKWMRRFKLVIEVEDVKEIIHSIRVRQNGLELDLTDVGFGISQVLPVIVQGFLAAEKSITLIEQPEIHLHPKMQADIADLAIDIVNSKDRRLIIETHSEYLLKRLRRRIAEGEIRAEDVAICLIHGSDSPNGASRIESIPITELGSFPWPKDFSETELDDTIAFAKLQVLSESDDSDEIDAEK
ncbi:AAA domain protein [Burkholderia sp. MSHR3999]|uniref:AAA family ATPase n=1 Tax=Burkholderia sp. MSHR3999 TaxID=1542965 RepID=UPI0005B72AE6|nr:AAA family ATPase [Burkholderia sp. MSHR3999]KIP14719.1 AAA domain protein [Burkholderia sp. MSHR3999]